MALETPWSVHSHLTESTVNGPGRRFVIWVQGCDIACDGCFNPDTHPRRQANSSVESMLDLVRGTKGLEGVTITGGEPLQQPESLRTFLGLLRRKTSLTSVVLTGYSRREIETHHERWKSVADADMVVCGRYNAALHIASGLRGSSNKEYWALTSQYNADDFQALPPLEVLVFPDGQVAFTGMSDMREGGGSSNEHRR